MTPGPRRAKREGIRQNGLLGMQYVDEFREKWLRERRPAGEPLVGTADVLISLAIVMAAPYCR